MNKVSCEDCAECRRLNEIFQVFQNSFVFADLDKSRILYIHVLQSNNFRLFSGPGGEGGGVEKMWSACCAECRRLNKILQSFQNLFVFAYLDESRILHILVIQSGVSKALFGPEAYL